MSVEPGYGVWIVEQKRWRRATCDGHPDVAVVYRDPADAVEEALAMTLEGLGDCEARPFDWAAERKEREA